MGNFLKRSEGSSSFKYLRIAALSIFVVLSIFNSEKTFPQDVQAWLDGFIVAPIGNSVENELNIGYNKKLGKNGWGDVYACNTLSFLPFGWYMAEGSAEYHYITDPTGPRINEVKFFLAQRFNFTGYIDKINLQLPYLYMRLEQRILNYPEDDTTEYRTRLRLRLGGRFLLNNDNLSAKTFYIPFYIETFHNFNGDAFERYASHSRVSVGLGYMFSPRWRGEFIHYTQRSGHNTEGGIEKTDVMFQVLIRYYILKRTPQ